MISFAALNNRRGQARQLRNVNAIGFIRSASDDLMQKHNLAIGFGDSHVVIANAW